MKTYKTYLIKSSHDIVVDDYKEGHKEAVTFYTMKDEVTAETPMQAVLEYFEETLGFDILEGDLCLDCDNCFACTDVLVNFDDYKPSKAQIKEWEQGKTALYNNHCVIEVYELKEII
jgi:hypothetical protein